MSSRQRFVAVWVFVAAVVAYDLDWSHRYANVADQWEANPVARLAFAAGGWPLAAALRVATIGGGFILAVVVRHRPAGRTLTQVAGLVHLYLAGVYLWEWV